MKQKPSCYINWINIIFINKSSFVNRPVSHSITPHSRHRTSTAFTACTWYIWAACRWVLFDCDENNAAATRFMKYYTEAWFPADIYSSPRHLFCYITQKRSHGLISQVTAWTTDVLFDCNFSSSCGEIQCKLWKPEVTHYTQCYSCGKRAWLPKAIPPVGSTHAHSTPLELLLCSR